MPRPSRKQRSGHSCFYAVFSHRFTICRVDMSISFSPHIKKAVCPIMENEIIKSCLFAKKDRTLLYVLNFYRISNTIKRGSFTIKFIPKFFFLVKEQVTKFFEIFKLNLSNHSYILTSNIFYI